MAQRLLSSSALPSIRLDVASHRSSMGVHKCIGEQLLSVQSSRISLHEDNGKVVTVHQESSKGKKRTYYLDWMRITSIYIVVVFHCVQALDWVDLWPTPQVLIVHLFRAASLQIGMPVFFHISGRAQALARHSDMRTVIMQRGLRLLLPFIVAYFLLIPAWTWIELDAQGATKDSLLQFQLRYFHPVYFIKSFNAAWLWFLPVLFLITVINLPLIEFLEVGSKGHLAFCFAFYAAIGVAMMILFGFTRMFVLLLFLIPGIPAAAVCLVPFPARIPSSQTSYSVPLETAVRQWVAIRVSTALYLLLSLAFVCNMRYTDLNLDGQFMPGCGLYVIFYLQGYFTVRWNSNTKEVFDSGVKAQVPEVLRLRSYVRMYEVATVLCVMLLIIISSPIGETGLRGEKGHHELWETAQRNSPFFPIYSASRYEDPTFAILHVLGTWSWLLVAVSIFQKYMDDEINSKLYKHAGASTMVIYMFHWIFIKPYAFYFVGVNGVLKGGWWNVFHLPMIFSVGISGSLLVYLFALNFKPFGRVLGL